VTARSPEQWAAIRRDYEAALYPSLRALAAAHGIARTAIEKRIRKDGWTQELRPATEAARRVAQAAEDGVPFPHVLAITTGRPEDATQSVQAAAATQVTVIRQHRGAIARDITMCDGLMGYLQLAVQTNPPDTVLQVDGLAETFEKLVRCRERLVRMERVAFGMNGTEGSEREDGPKLTDEQQEALREAIRARFGVGRVIEGEVSPA